jgi:hypothetical protein
MADIACYGASKRGKQTLIFNNFEYWQKRTNAAGQTQWCCTKREMFKCPARLVSVGKRVVGNISPEHTHEGNVATALARQAVGFMKSKMTETVATPSAAQGSVAATLAPAVLMALPKRATLSRALRHHRQQHLHHNADGGYPPIPTDLTFPVPAKFAPFLLHDSGPGEQRILIFGDNGLLDGLARADIWIADGTFKVVPNLFFQLYTIHFQFVRGINPAALYCLLQNKTRNSYDRVMAVLKQLIPSASPAVILTDFEKAAMSAFADTYPTARVTGCYFHLNQAVLRKVNELGMKASYESDDDIRGMVRCLPALAHVPVDSVEEAFELLAESMPEHEHMNELVSYFEHTFIRGRRQRGRGNNYGPALFPIPTWNQFEAAGDGIPRTTNIVEGWHNALQALFMCSHPSLWSCLDGLQQDCHKQTAAYLQGATGVQQQPTKRYRTLVTRVAAAVATFGRTDVLTYLRAIAHLSHT